MSVRVLTSVFEHSQAKGTELLLLLVLADTAHDDGIAWSDQKAIAAKGRLTDRTVRTLTTNLVELGELQTHEFRKGRSPRLAYRVVLPGVREPDLDRLPAEIATLFHPEDSSGSDSSSPGNLTSVHPEAPNTRARETNRKENRKTRALDPVWDELVSLFGAPSTRTERSHRGKIVREIKAAIDASVAAGETRDEYDARRALIRSRHAALVNAWGREKVTADALVKHWTFAGQLASTPPSGPRYTDGDETI